MTIDDVIDALGAFIKQVLGSDTVVIRGLQNRVSPPITAFVELTELTSSDLETPTSSKADSELTITGPAQIAIQIDFYGPSAGDWCRAIKGVYRSSYCASQFPDGIAPLYCSDGNQSPLITGEEQYESRWVATAFLQYNTFITVPYQSATNKLSMNVTGDLT